MREITIRVLGQPLQEHGLWRAMSRLGWLVTAQQGRVFCYVPQFREVGGDLKSVLTMLENEIRRVAAGE